MQGPLVYIRCHHSHFMRFWGLYFWLVLASSVSTSYAGRCTSSSILSNTSHPHSVMANCLSLFNNFSLSTWQHAPLLTQFAMLLATCKSAILTKLPPSLLLMMARVSGSDKLNEISQKTDNGHGPVAHSPCVPPNSTE